MTCSSCGKENPPDSLFCEECGATFERACPACGAKCSPTAKFCRKCRTSLRDDAPEPPAPRSYTPAHLADRILAEQAAMEARGAQEGERKTITALFADIKGSVEMMEDLDPEDARSIVDPALHLMMDAVHRYEGYVAQSRGAWHPRAVRSAHRSRRPSPASDLRSAADAGRYRLRNRAAQCQRAIAFWRRWGGERREIPLTK